MAFCQRRSYFAKWHSQLLHRENNPTKKRTPFPSLPELSIPSVYGDITWPFTPNWILNHRRVMHTESQSSFEIISVPQIFCVWRNIPRQIGPILKEITKVLQIIQLMWNKSLFKHISIKFTFALPDRYYDILLKENGCYCSLSCFIRQVSKSFKFFFSIFLTSILLVTPNNLLDLNLSTISHLWIGMKAYCYKLLTIILFQWNEEVNPYVCAKTYETWNPVSWNVILANLYFL